MTRYLLLSDIHATKRAPSSCTDSYYTDLLGLLYQTLQVAEEQEVDAVIWAGDVFHHKAPSRTPHEVVLDLATVIKSYPCPVAIVGGNHDMQNDRYDSIARTQPLGELYAAGAVELAGWDHFHSAMSHIYGVPWLQGYGDYTGHEWTEEEPAPISDGRVAEALAGYRGEDLQGPYGNTLVVAHAPLYPPGKELPYEHFPAERWAQAMGGRGAVFYGHVHEPHGVYEAGGVRFCNNGALSRGSLHEYNLHRQVGVTTWDSDTNAFAFIPLKIRPASEVFRLAEAAEERTVKAEMDQFLADIGSTRLEVLSIESVLATIRSKGLGKGVEDLAEELLAQAQDGGKR